MAVRTKRLAGPFNTTAGGAVAYTVPAGKTAIVKFINAASSGPPGGTIRVLHQINAASPLRPLEDFAVVGGSAASGRAVYLTMGPAERLWGQHLDTAGGYLWLWGVELDGVAP